MSLIQLRLVVGFYYELLLSILLTFLIYFLLVVFVNTAQEFYKKLFVFLFMLNIFIFICSIFFTEKIKQF